jgi:hypothetical protein
MTVCGGWGGEVCKNVYTYRVHFKQMNIKCINVRNIAHTSLLCYHVAIKEGPPSLLSNGYRGYFPRE